MWLKRFIDGVLAKQKAGDAQLERATAVLERRGIYCSTDHAARSPINDAGGSSADDDDALLEALLEALTVESVLSDAALARVARALRMRANDGLDIDPAVQLQFWGSLAASFGEHPYVHACWGDALRDAGREAEGLDRGLHAIELDPSLLVEFGEDLRMAAERAGASSFLRYQLVELRARLQDAEQADRADELREFYSGLLEDYRADPQALERIRGLGAEINRLVADDKLPRAFVRRTR